MLLVEKEIWLITAAVARQVEQIPQTAAVDRYKPELLVAMAAQVL